METIETIGKRLKLERKALNLSLTDLSVLTEVSERTIIRIENGKTNVGFNTVSKLLKALNLEINIS